MDEQVEARSTRFIELAIEIVAAYVSNNNVPVSELPGVIAAVHASFTGLSNGAAAELACPEKPTPAQIRKSITPDHLISFLDGKPYKMLKRHLFRNGLTIEEYRLRFGLPADYPSTSANHSAQRAKLARSTGLGKLRWKLEYVPAAPTGTGTIPEPSKPRGRPRKGVPAVTETQEPDVAVEAPKAVSKVRVRKKIAETA